MQAQAQYRPSPPTTTSASAVSSMRNPAKLMPAPTARTISVIARRMAMVPAIPGYSAPRRLAGSGLIALCA